MSTGLSHVKYVGSNGLMGGWTLHLDLVVDHPHKKASGTAILSRAVQGQEEITFPRVNGPLIIMATMENVHYRMDLASEKMAGRQIDVQVVVKEDWKTGTAKVNAFLDTPDGNVSFEVPIKQAE